MMWSAATFCSMIANCFHTDRQPNGECVQCKVLSVAYGFLCQSTTLMFGLIFLKLPRGCSIFVHAQSATIRSKQYICPFGEKVSRRSYGCYLKVCFSQSSVAMIESIDFTSLPPTLSRLHCKLFYISFH
jgi:hypothetical protein